MSHPSSITLTPDEQRLLTEIRARLTITRIAAEADVSVSTVQRLQRGKAANRATVNAVRGAMERLGAAVARERAAAKPAR